MYYGSLDGRSQAIFRHRHQRAVQIGRIAGRSLVVVIFVVPLVKLFINTEIVVEVFKYIVFVGA